MKQPKPLDKDEARQLLDVAAEAGVPVGALVAAGRSDLATATPPRAKPEALAAMGTNLLAAGIRSPLALPPTSRLPWPCSPPAATRGARARWPWSRPSR